MSSFQLFPDGESQNVCGLTYKQRLMGFVCCFVFGMMLSFLSMLSLYRPVSFSILYTLGNIVSFMSSSFIWGPKRHLKSAIAKKRIGAFLVFLGSMIVTLVVAIKLKNIALCLVCIVIQFLALSWYSLSYIPHGRQAVLGIIKGCFRR